MQFNRREFLGTSVLGGAALAGGIGFAPDVRAQQMVDTLQMFVPAAPGGGWDGTARTMEQALRAAGLIGTAQVTNVPGAGGVVGLPQFINQWRGRQNALMVMGMVMIGSIITNKAPVNLSTLTPIARLTEEYLAVVVPAESPHRDMRSLVAALKANPGGVSWAGGSAGGSDHILVGLICQAVGVDATKASYVPFAGGGPATAAILGNQVTAGVSGLSEFAEQVKAGRMRLLAISAAQRVPGIDAPTLREQGVDTDLTNWRGVYAPAGVNAQQKQAMITLMERMNASAQWKEECTKRDWTPTFLAGDAFGTYVTNEFTRLSGILKTLGLA
jgi:putative tricarboxylic transport membrane protein